MPGRVSLNQANIARLLESPAGGVWRAVEVRTRATLNAARARAPVDEGTLRTSLRSQITVDRTAVTGRVWTPLAYGLYQQTGTGIYGPRHRVITPKTHRFLRFQAKGPEGPLRAGARAPAPGNRRWVYARYVRGTPRNPFLTDGLHVGSGGWFVTLRTVI